MMKKCVSGGVTAAAVALAITGCSTRPFTDVLSDARALQRQMMQRYVDENRFGQPLPKLEGAQLAKFRTTNMPEENWKRLCAAVEDEFNECKRTLVYPKWVDVRISDIDARITELVRKGCASAATNGFAIARENFEKAREAGWQGSVTNVGIGGEILPEIYGPVHKAAVGMIGEKVGVAEWPVVERELNLIVTNAVVNADLPSGIKALQDYRYVRAYTQILDGKVGALLNELKRLGVSEAAANRIATTTEKWMRQYENLSDLSEKSVTEKKMVGGSGARRDMSAYKRLLKEYEAALLQYDCTNANTKKIVDALAKVASGLIDNLPKPEPAVEVQEQRLVRLGATALNRRIDACRKEMIAYLEKAIEDVKAQGESLTALMRGEPEKAFAKVGAILLGVEKSSESVRAMAMRKLLTEINPELLKKREAEMRAMIDKFAREGKCAEGVAWFAAYRPYVRTYAEEIDQRFGDVRDAAVDFGVAKDGAEKIMSDVARVAAELDYLADYTDKLVDEVKPGTKVPQEKLAKFEAAVEACRIALVRNGCTEANAEKLLQTIRDRFAAERVVLEADVHTSVMFLGSNALNSRLRALKVACVGELISRCASALAARNQFAEARTMLRDIALSGDAEFDVEVYAIRIGVLNTVINPVQCAKRKAEIRAHIDECWKKGDVRAVRDWMRDYPYVHDDYPEVMKAAKSVQTAMEKLKIAEPDPERYMKKVLAKFVATLEAAKSDYVVPTEKPDLSELERAIELFEKAYLAQYYKPQDVAAVGAGVLADVKLFLDKTPECLSTADVNVALRAEMEFEVRRHIVADAEARKPRYRLADDPVQADVVKNAVLDAAKKGLVAFTAGKKKEEVYGEIAGAIEKPALDWLKDLWNEMNAPKTAPTLADASTMTFDELTEMLVERQEYLEFLAAMDKEVVYDSQIAMAEDAISKQLGVVAPEARLQVNAMLGEYARAMRLLKQAKTLNADQGSALVFGSVYLDQPAVLTRAFDLGADINAVSARDPYKRSPLLLAIQLGRTGFVHTLVERGANLVIADANGDTAVHYAVRRGNLAVLKAMLSKVDVDAVNVRGETALFDAARANEPAIVRALIAAKADVRKATANGLSALDAACTAGSRDVLEPLAEAEAVFGPQQLILAARADRLAVAQWLVSKGVDVNSPGVMDAAAKSSNVLEFLLRQGGVLPPAEKK